MRHPAAFRALGALAGLAGLVLTGIVACSSSDVSSGKTLTVVYENFGPFTPLDDQMRKATTEFEAECDGCAVTLVPVEASENDYYTKLSLMNRSAKTAPDVMYEDTFLINTDIEAGYLAPLDDYLATWAEWNQFNETAKRAAEGADGKTYGVPMGTDTRALWYNKDLFLQSGISVPWEPKSWDDVLAAARTIHNKLPDVIPLNVYSGKGQGEGATMQGLEMLLYGTADTLYDEGSHKWITSSTGLLDSLTFLDTIFDENLAPDPQDALNPNFGTTVINDLIPNGKLAIGLDGSWVSGTWLSTGATPWEQWSTVLGQTPMPTQNGQEPGATSMSGGWVLSVGAKSIKKDLAFDFVSTMLNKKNSLAYDIAASQLAVRNDVAAEPTYTSENPTVEFFTNLVSVTHFRPAYTGYPHISDALQVAMEAVMTDQQTPQEAMRAYATTVAAVVGEDQVTSA